MESNEWITTQEAAERLGVTTTRIRQMVPVPDYDPGPTKTHTNCFWKSFQSGFSEADVVMCYLMPDALTKLEKKFKRELRSGTRVVSNRFTFPTLEIVQEDGDARLYLIYPDGEK